MSPRPAPTGPDISTPELCRAEADRLQKASFDLAVFGSDLSGSARLADRCRDLRLLAAKLERDELKQRKAKEKA